MRSNPSVGKKSNCLHPKITVHTFFIKYCGVINIFEKNLKPEPLKNLKNVLALLLISVCSIAATAQTSEEIVANHIKAIGGKENWEKLKSIKMEGTIKAQGAEIKLTSYQVDKKAMRENITVMGMNGYSIVTTTEGWSYMPFGGQTKPEPMTADDLKNAQEDLYLADAFITYAELGKKLEYLGKDDFDGTDCYKFKMTDKNAKETTYYIDASNYYILKQTNKVKANGQEMENAVVFSDYKKLDEGIFYPMSVASGYGQMQVSKLEVNVAIDDATFQLPKDGK